VDDGVIAHEVDCSPIAETVMRPLECGTPRKVKFQDETLTESLEAWGWTDVIPRGASTLDEDSDPAFDDSLWTNQIEVNLKLMWINVEALEIQLAKGSILHESTLESLGSQIHDARVQVGKDPGMYTSGEESVWEGTVGVHGKVDFMEGKIRADITAEMILMMAQVKLKEIIGTYALAQREVALATHQLCLQVQAVQHKHIANMASLEAEVTRIGSLRGSSGGQHLCSSLNSDFPADWDLVLDFQGRHTSPGSGRVGDKI
jgi:hypothetical protein